MKKSARTPAQRAADNQEEKRAAILRAVAKCGLATRHHFLTAIKRAGGFTDEQAASEFGKMLNAGQIRFVRFNDGGDVGIYEADKNISA